MINSDSSKWIKYPHFIIADALSLHLAQIAAFALRFPEQRWIYTDRLFVALGSVMLLLLLLSSYLLNSFGDIAKRNGAAELSSVGTLTFSMLLLTALFQFLLNPVQSFSRLFVLYTSVFFLILDYAARSILKRVLHNRSGVPRHQKWSKSIVLVTERRCAEELIENLRSDFANPFVIKGLVLCDSEGTGELDGIPVVSDLDEAAMLICRNWVDEVLLYYPDGGGTGPAFLEKCAEMGVTVHEVLNLRNVDRNKQYIDSIGSHTVLTTAFGYISPLQAFVKRCIDILGALVGCALTIILTLIIGPMIYFSSPGPIFFSQKRVGKNGKVFRMLKFRSMVPDADARKAEYAAKNKVADGMMFKLDFDPRIIGNRELPDGTRKTGIGEFIRKTSLDEFPQFFNVLRGDMSLVGTRPPTVDEWEKYQYHHRRRLAMKPGITGLWQVSGRSDITDFEEVVKLDTEYICNYRLSLDFQILFKTVALIFSGKGAL